MVFLVFFAAPLRASCAETVLEEGPGSAVPAESEQEFTDQVQRDYRLRQLVHLRVSNPRGKIQIRGWSQDKVRILAKRRVLAKDDLQANNWFSTMDIRHEDRGGEIEITAQYGNALSMMEKLKERRAPKAFMDLEILAPAKMSLTLLGNDHDLSVESWNAPVEIRALSGTVRLTNSQSGKYKIVCPQCPVSLTDLIGPVHVVTDAGLVELADVRGDSIYIQTRTAPIQLDTVNGKQSYVTESGLIQGRYLEGWLQFQSRSGTVKIASSKGFVSGRTTDGPIEIEMKSWNFQDKAFLESETGNILLTLPSTFSGEMDVRSDLGSTSMEFPLRATKKHGPLLFQSAKRSAETESGRLKGVVGESGGDYFRIFSTKGNIRILKGP